VGNDLAKTSSAYDDQIQRLQAVNSVALAVGRSLDLTTVLESALVAALKIFSVDSGGIYLYDPDSKKLSLEVFKNLTKDYLDEKSDLGVADGCTGVAVRSQEIFAAFDHPESQFICEDSERLLGVDCLVAAPLLVGDKVLGVLELFAPTSRRLTREEAQLLTSISSQIGIAVDNAHRYQQSLTALEELEKTRRELTETNAKLQSHLEEEAFIARTLQQSLLPSDPAPIEGLDVGTFYASATKHALVGGDFYDIIPLAKDKVAFVIGDASGHGVVVSPRSAAVKFSIRSYLGVGRSPARTLELSNQTFMSQNTLDSFVTAFVTMADPKTGELKYALAGHPPALVYRPAHGGGEILESGTPALGITLDSKYKLHKVTLGRGDVMLLYTDGLTEARNPDTHQFFGFSRAFKVLEQNFEKPAKDIASSVARAAYDFAGGSLVDDIAIMAIKRED